MTFCCYCLLACLLAVPLVHAIVSLLQCVSRGVRHCALWVHSRLLDQTVRGIVEGTLLSICSHCFLLHFPISVQLLINCNPGLVENIQEHTVVYTL